MKIKTDCSLFPLDRPCRLHKEKRVRCSDCGSYTPLSARGKDVRRILIVKLGAMGDVLRTTFLLPGLKEKYPGASIAWIVAPGSEPILNGNPLISEIWPNDKKVFSRLLSSSFDIVVNLDLAPESLALATLAVARKKIGYVLDAQRKIICSNTAAAEWLCMSADDALKQKNRRTYQHWMARITGLPRADYEIFTPLLKDSAARAKAFAVRHGLNGKRVVGINPGAGGRWTLKKWTFAGYRSLIDRLHQNGFAVLLLGGPDEKDLIARLARASKGRAVSAGTDNSLPDFFALLNLCELLVCGDTLALHAVLGLKKKAVALFGPTSAAEIELYGRGRKVVAPVPCVCCYRQECPNTPTCMESITLDAVWSCVESLLAQEKKNQ